VEKAEASSTAVAQEEVRTDAFGNVIQMNESDLDDKKKKKLIKDIEKQLKAQKTLKLKNKPTLSENEVWELEDRLAQLQA